MKLWSFYDGTMFNSFVGYLKMFGHQGFPELEYGAQTFFSCKKSSTSLDSNFCCTENNPIFQKLDDFDRKMNSENDKLHADRSKGIISGMYVVKILKR